MSNSGNKSNFGHYIHVNGLKMWYEDHGSGHPLILLHGGLGTAHTSWSRYIPILAQKYRIIAPDCRGRGKTDNPEQKISYKLLTEDIVALIKELNLIEPIICGWSDGGQIALEIGIKYPKLAKAIIVGGALAAISEPYLESLRKIGFNGAGNVDIEVFQDKMPKYVEILESLHSSIYGPNYWKSLLLQSSHMWFDPDGFPGDNITELNIPCLLIIGDRDEAISVEENLKIFKRIPNSELCVLPNTTHAALHKENLSIFSDIILDFINRVLT